MPLILLLAFLLFLGVCFLLFVWAQIAYRAVRRCLGHIRNAGMIAPSRERQGQSAGVEGVFIPGFREIHLVLLVLFDLVYSLLASMIWGSYYHSFKAIFMIVCGPFTTAILDPTEEHWKFAWVLFPFCAAFVQWGVFCQLVRLPFQRNPGPVALLMWALGLMVWFDAGILSYLMAM